MSAKEFPNIFLTGDNFGEYQVKRTFCSHWFLQKRLKLAKLAKAVTCKNFYLSGEFASLNTAFRILYQSSFLSVNLA